MRFLTNENKSKSLTFGNVATFLGFYFVFARLSKIRYRELILGFTLFDFVKLDI